MLDTYQVIQPDRISPEAPVIIGKHRDTEYRLGGAANAAHNCSVLHDGEVYLYGAVGGDTAGGMIATLCKEAGIISSLSIHMDGKTTEKRRIVDGQGRHFLRIDRDCVLESEIKPKSWWDRVLFSDYGKGMFTEQSVSELIDAVRNDGGFVVVNGKPKNVWGYRRAHCLVFNYDEAYEAAQICGIPWLSGEAFFEPLYRTLRETQDGCLETLVVTQGEQGLTRITESGIAHIKARKVEVVDPVGAGDTISASIAVRGDCSNETLRWAALNAAQVVAKHGTAVPE